MKDILYGILDEYSKQLTKHQINQYVTKLRDYFIPYLIEHYEGTDIIHLFRNEFTRSDIINSTVYYIKNNTNVKSVSAIDDFLISLNSLFQNKILKDYSNQNIAVLIPFNQLSEEIHKKLKVDGIVLKEKESKPSINNDEYNFIIEYLNNSTYGRLMSYQRPIILELFLLYGFSFDTLANLKRSAYNPMRNSLRIEFMNDKRNIVDLELPYKFRKQFIELLTFRDTTENLSSKYLFVTENNNMITHQAAFQELDKIREAYELEMDIQYNEYLSNPFTATGLQKYAIINMLLSGMNETIISAFTNQKEDIMRDCQSKVGEQYQGDINRYVNHMIRGIASYDTFNADD